MKFSGKNYSIETNDIGQVILVHPVSENEIFDSFEELVESHPVCEESRVFFFGPESSSTYRCSIDCGRVSVDVVASSIEQAKDKAYDSLMAQSGLRGFIDLDSIECYEIED